MELFRHELYKVFGRKIIWLGLLFFVVLIGFSALAQASQSKKTYGDMGTYYSSMYQGNEGKVSITIQKKAQNWLIANDNAYFLSDSEGRATIQENRLFSFYDQALSSKDILTQRSQQISKLQDNLKSSITADGKSSFNPRMDSLYIGMLKQLTPPGLFFTIPLENDLNFPFGLGFCVMCVLIFLGVSPIFTDEYTVNMDSLILSAKKGRGKVVTAKILATTLYCTFVALAIPLANFCFQASYLGIKGWNAPLQLDFDFSKSPYLLSFGGYLLLQTLIGVIACIFLGMLVLLVSSVSKNVMIPFFSCGCLIAFTAFIKTTFATAAPSALTAFANFSYTELMRVQNLIATFKTYDFFGFPILYLNLILIIYSIITAIIIYLIYRIFPRHQVQ